MGCGGPNFCRHQVACLTEGTQLHGPSDIPKLALLHAGDGKTDNTEDNDWKFFVAKGPMLNQWAQLFEAGLVEWKNKQMILKRNMTVQLQTMNPPPFQGLRDVHQYLKRNKWRRVLPNRPNGDIVWDAPQPEDREKTQIGTERLVLAPIAVDKSASVNDEMHKNVIKLEDYIVSICWTMEEGQWSRYYLCLVPPFSELGKNSAQIHPDLVDKKYNVRTGSTGLVNLLLRSVPFLTSMRVWHNHGIEDKRAQSWHNSHLCHNGMCFSLLHICQESGPKNVGRNGCGGSQLCQHYPTCLVPGPAAYH